MSRKIVVGIDIGGSTTKIGGFDITSGRGELMAPLFVHATDPITSIYGAFGKFTDSNGLELSDIEKVMITGVGSSHVSRPLYSLPCETVPEFRCIGLGGLYLSGLDRAITVSMGTGTALVLSERGREPEHLGGTGVGGGVIVSLVCFAPADDPQVMMLLTLDEPSKWTGTYVSGGNMVAPVASSVMGEILPYLGIEPSYTAEELVGADKTVPNVVGLSKDAAAERLSANGFSFRTVGSGDTVTDQTPAGGAIVPNSAEIILYLGAEKSTDKCIVPNVVGDSAATANQKIVNAGLIMGVSGATNASSSTVRAISQSIAAGTEVEAGTVVRVQFSDSSVRD